MMFSKAWLKNRIKDRPIRNRLREVVFCAIELRLNGVRKDGRTINLNIGPFLFTALPDQRFNAMIGPCSYKRMICTLVKRVKAKRKTAKQAERTKRLRHFRY